MAAVDLVPGTRFRLYRMGDDDTPGFVCLATTISLVTTREADPDDVVGGGIWSNFAPTVKGWSLEFAGRVSPRQFAAIEDDQMARELPRYRIVTDVESGRSYTGRLLIERLSRGMTDRGFLAFEASCRGSDALTFT